jgi:hypothetical protein
MPPHPSGFNVPLSISATLTRGFCLQCPLNIGFSKEGVHIIRALHAHCLRLPGWGQTSPQFRDGHEDPRGRQVLPQHDLCPTWPGSGIFSKCLHFHLPAFTLTSHLQEPTSLPDPGPPSSRAPLPKSWACQGPRARREGLSFPAPSSLGSPSHYLVSVPPEIPTIPRYRPAPSSLRPWDGLRGLPGALTSGRPHLPLSAYGDSPAA